MWHGGGGGGGGGELVSVSGHNSFILERFKYHSLSYSDYLGGQYFWNDAETINLLQIPYITLYIIIHCYIFYLQTTKKNPV